MQKLAAALQAALKHPDLVKRFGDINMDPVADGGAMPEPLSKLLLSEIDRWAPIINAGRRWHNARSARHRHNGRART